MELERPLYALGVGIVGTLIFSRPTRSGASSAVGLFICFSFLSLVYYVASLIGFPRQVDDACFPAVGGF